MGSTIGFMSGTPWGRTSLSQAPLGVAPHFLRFWEGVNYVLLVHGKVNLCFCLLFTAKTKQAPEGAEDKIVWAGLDAYMYDVDGFLTTRTIGGQTDTFNYSSRGELLSVNLVSGDSISYDHDPMGRRIAKRINGAITEQYLWQGATTLLAVYDGSDNLLQRFEYADGRVPVVMTSGGQVYYLAYDQVGSLRVVTDAAGVEVKRVDYDSFGNVLSDSSLAFSVPFGFAGGLHDRDTGLVRFGARDYDPATGKWTAKDPIDFEGKDLNLLSYTLQDPINLVDPEGLDVWVYHFKTLGGGWGHIGLILPNADGSFTRYSQGADNTKAPIWQLLLWQRKADVDVKILPTFRQRGSEVIRIPTENNEQIKLAIDKYIEADWPYNMFTNNCADFVNDVLHAADDLPHIPNVDIPTSYFGMLKLLFGPCD